MRVAIIGAGASGLMAAAAIVSKGHDVTVFEGNEKCGKKIYITGKGRCNFTNLSDRQTFLENVVRGGKFLQSALSRFSPQDAIDFFERWGMKSKVERGNRVFPVSDKASDVTAALLRACDGVKFKLSHKVKIAYKSGEEFFVDGEAFDRLVIATGGKSYSATGSDGSGYALAKKFGHTIVDCVPALVPIEVEGAYISSLQGLSLKNVRLTAVCDEGNESEFGEMLFTDKGVSGPIVLTLSSKINRKTCRCLELDFKPALSEEKLDGRLLREFDAAKNKQIKSVMLSLLPSRFVAIFLKRAEISEDRRVQSITAAERKRLVKLLKCFTIKFKKLYPIENAVVTSGGVEHSQVNPKTMQSKLVSGLYFAGEILDVDALTGGFNLQIAFATAQAVGSDF